METGIRISYLVHLQRSYRTYEEWKPCNWGYLWKIVKKFLPYLWGMETGFFFFIIHANPSFLPYLWGMETAHGSNLFNTFSAFLPYLWGMETSYSTEFEHVTWTFLPYLWGMETIHQQLSHHHIIRSYRTYEEWKPTMLMQAIVYVWVLTVPMRNGN